MHDFHVTGLIQSSTTCWRINKVKHLEEMTQGFKVRQNQDSAFIFHYHNQEIFDLLSLNSLIVILFTAVINNLLYRVKLHSINLFKFDWDKKCDI